MHTSNVPPVTEIHADEFSMLRKVASAFRVTDREELQVELAAKLLELKRRAPKEVRDWMAYLAKFFYNKAHNFARDERARARREWVAMPGEPSCPEPARAAEDETARLELSLALARVWREIEPQDRKLWSILADNNGNQCDAGLLLGMHRNTVRRRVKRIRRILEQHGIIGVGT